MLVYAIGTGKNYQWWGALRAAHVTTSSSDKMKRNVVDIVNVCTKPSRYLGLAQGSGSFHHGYKSPNEIKAMASHDKIDALDKEDGSNGGEAGCEKGTSNGAG